MWNHSSSDDEDGPNGKSSSGNTEPPFIDASLTQSGALVPDDLVSTSKVPEGSAPEPSDEGENDSPNEDESDSHNEEKEDESGESSASESSEEEEDEESEDSDASPPAKKKRGMDQKTKKLLEDENFLRRSSRSRKNKSDSEDEETEDSEDEWSDEPKKKRRAPPPKAKKAIPKKKVERRKSGHKSVNYAEKSSDDEIDEDDVLEWEEEEAPAEMNESTASQPTSESVERVIKWRQGIPGATGSATTGYNVKEKGDPNSAEGERTETQFLVKWVGWSHIHNTWESENSLLAMNAKGIKRVQNYVKKQQEVEIWRKHADKEYIEVYDCEQVMAEELIEDYKKVERIVAHMQSRDNPDVNEYMVKWNGLPYSECTWEVAKLVDPAKIDEYHFRSENVRPPTKNHPMLQKRPRFVKLDEIPEYLIADARGNMRQQTLRDYQLEGLNWMLHAWCKGNSSILADEMGLGKTIQSISFIASLFHRYDLTGPFLVVVPLSTMAAWQKEFAQWAPAMNMVTYMGDVASRDHIRQYEWYVGGTKKMKINAILTTYEILLKDKTFLASVDWAALLVDEAHRLKNDESLLYKCLSQFRCNHKLLITGTPLQNSLKELWALLHFIMPEKFDSWDDFEADHNDKDHKGISALHRKLEPFLLRRVKKDVEKSLPPKTEQILRVDMTAHQKQYYKWILTKNYRELSKGVKGSINGFVNLVMELKKCCNHSSLIRQYDDIRTDAQSRLQQLLKSSGKLILLDKLLVRLKDTGHRVLIFSQMVMMLDILQEYLQLRRFPTQRLDGSMRADLRKQALDHYNAPGSTDFAFLLSTRAGGLGINLATADTVIIFDSDWNPQNDLQAMSRAHRIGQKKTVSIYRLVTKNSVEEDIVERAKRKLVLDHLVIQRMDTTGKTVLSKSSTNGSSVPFGKQELNAILKFGAADLFKEKEGEEQEPEVDIDMILSGAETREAEDANENGNDLLNSFKYATFRFDEEKDIAVATEGNDEGEAWDSIIPEDKRRQIEEEERIKALAEINLAPRVRAKPTERSRDHDDDEAESSGSSDEEGGGRKKRKKAWGDFSTAELKRFVRSFRKFSNPLDRLEALAQDAELEEHSTGELHRVTEALLEACKKALNEHKSKEKENEEQKKEQEKRDKGPVVKFGGVDVNVRMISKSHKELEPLHKALHDATKASEWKPPKMTKAQKGWDVEWVWMDDGALLWGVYKYGLGSWESIKLDPALGLTDKIFLKDKTKKPQPKHLQQRVDYLLKVMRKVSNGREPRRNMNLADRSDRKRKAPDADKKPEKKKKESIESVKKEKKPEKERDKTLAEQLQLLVIDSNAYGKALDDRSEKPFKECVRLCRPVQKYLKKLKDAQDEKNEEEEKRYVMRVGDSFRDIMEDYIKEKPKANIRKWYNYLWIFLCKFVSREPAQLVAMYRTLATNNKHRHHHKDKRDHKEHSVSKDKEKEKEKDVHRDKKPNHHHHHHHKDGHRDEKRDKERDKERDHRKISDREREKDRRHSNNHHEKDRNRHDDRHRKERTRDS